MKRFRKNNKTDCLVGSEDLRVIIMFLNTYIHIQRETVRSPDKVVIKVRIKTQEVRGLNHRLVKCLLLSFLIFCPKKIGFLKTNGIWLMDKFKMVLYRKGKANFVFLLTLFSLVRRKSLFGDVKNYRGIALLRVLGKVFSKFI